MSQMVKRSSGREAGWVIEGKGEGGEGVGFLFASCGVLAGSDPLVGIGDAGKVYKPLITFATRSGTARAHTRVVPSHILSQFRSSAEGGESGQASSGEMVEMLVKAITPTMTTVAQRASRAEGMIGEARAERRYVVVWFQWWAERSSTRIGELDGLAAYRGYMER